MSRPPATGFDVARGSANPAATLLRGAGVPALLAVAGLAVVALFASPASSASVLVGGGMALVAMTVPPLLQQLCRDLDPSMVLGIVVLAYFTVMGLLGIGYLVVNDASWLVGGFAGAGVFAVALVWTVGQMRASIKLRQLLYQSEELPLGDK